MAFLRSAPRLYNVQEKNETEHGKGGRVAVDEQLYSDKRRYMRVIAQMEVECEVPSPEGEAVPARRVLGFTKNLSLNGICFDAGGEFKTGTPLRIKLHVPDRDEPLEMEGEVIRCERMGEGVKTKFRTAAHLFTVDRSDEGLFMGYVFNRMVHCLTTSSRG